MAETVAAIKAIFDAWEGNSRLDFRGEFFTHTLMPPNFNPGPNPFGPPPIFVGSVGTGDDPQGRRGGRRVAGHAVQQRPAHE